MAFQPYHMVVIHLFDYREIEHWVNFSHETYEGHQGLIQNKSFVTFVCFVRAYTKLFPREHLWW